MAKEMTPLQSKIMEVVNTSNDIMLTCAEIQRKILATLTFTDNCNVRGVGGALAGLRKRGVLEFRGLELKEATIGLVPISHDAKFPFRFEPGFIRKNHWYLKSVKYADRVLFIKKRRKHIMQVANKRRAEEMRSE